MPLDEEKQKRLDALRTKREELALAEQQDADERELQAEELAATLEETIGKRGVDFAIVSNRFGVFALRRPDTQAIRNWERADDKKKLSLEWQIGLLKHYIVPESTSLLWAQTGAQRPGLVWQTSNEFVDLMGLHTDGGDRK